MGSHFHADALNTRGSKLGELAMNADGVGSRVVRCGTRRGNPVPDRPDVGGRAAAVLQSLRQQPGARSLSVRAGDSNDGQRLSGRTEEAIGNGANVAAQIGDGGHKNIGAEMRQLLDA